MTTWAWAGDQKLLTVRRAVEWYSTHGRLNCGDPIAMAPGDALAAYRADTAAGKDSLLLCDTTEMTDPSTTASTATTSTPTHTHRHRGAGHRIGAGDLVVSRRNDPTITLRAPNGAAGQLDSVRNGNRWRVAAIDPVDNRVAAERLHDRARTVFEGDYLREHVSLGYAVTVHSAQGVTADTTHAVLGENTTRCLLYVAMARGRHANTAYLHEGTFGENEHGPQELDGTHHTCRGAVVKPPP